MVRGNLIDHLEGYLGEIVAGFNFGEPGPPPFQVARFGGGLLPGVGAIATIGLSGHVLHQTSGNQLRHELLFLFPASGDPASFPAILKELGDDCLKTHHAYARGEVIGPRGPLIPGSRCEALYVAPPAYYPEDFEVYEEPELPPIVIAWLVPITAAEARFAREHGPERFEAEVHRIDPDLLDFGRESFVLPFESGR
jgi:hypothetical protein